MSEMIDVQRVSHPQQTPGDVVLPMPGNLVMPLRAVCLPTAGFFDEASMRFGVSRSGVRPVGQYMEGRYTTSLQAPFEFSDLPDAWGKDALKVIAKDPVCGADKESGRLYFIGKYELTRGQWRAVMEHKEGDFALELDDFKPVTDVSWFDAQAFSRRYSEWLMQNHPEMLPFFQVEGRSAFLRLPTEAEWEYAARGGHRVSDHERENTLLFPFDGKDAGEYVVAGVFEPTLSSVMRIGSKQPNPLGLYDILGNCAEMTQSPFRFSLGGRLLGGEGGFLVKGGSWRAMTLEELHPGRRLEASYYADAKALARDDLGFRLVLSGVFTPKDRQERMDAEWKALTQPGSFASTEKDKDEDIRIALQEVGAQVRDSALKQRLADIENAASRYYMRVNTNEERMIKEMLLGAAFSLETVANYAARCYQLIELRDGYLKLSRSDKGKEEQHAREAASMDEEIRNFIYSIKNVLFFYKKTVDEVQRLMAGKQHDLLDSVQLQFAHDDAFSKRLLKRMEIVARHSGTADIQSHDELAMLKTFLPEWLMVKLKTYF